MTIIPQVQQAIYNLLIADSELMTKVTGVFDEVPDGQKLPFVTIGEFTEIPRNTLTKRGREVTVTLHIWSEKEGFDEAQKILADVTRILDYATLNIIGFVSCIFEFSEAIRVDELRHIPVRFRIFAEEV